MVLLVRVRENKRQYQYLGELNEHAGEPSRTAVFNVVAGKNRSRIKILQASDSDLCILVHSEGIL